MLYTTGQKHGNMKIEVFTICYNEEVMLPYFLRHYSSFCDKITIYDNYSTDRSDEIMRANPKVEVRKYDSGNEIRDDIYLEIKNNCWKGSKADWVIVGDIDELLVSRIHKAFLPTLLNTVPGCSILMPSWYDMISKELPAADGQIYDELPFGVFNPNTKALIFRPDRINEINYAPGAHFIDPKGDVNILNTDALIVLHYKYLSLQYVIDRYRLFASRLSEINKKLNWGYHYNFTVEQITAEYNNLMSKRVNVWEH